jgi:hypothetical protein
MDIVFWDLHLTHRATTPMIFPAAFASFINLMDLSRPAVIELQHQEIVPCSATVKLGANQATLH